MGNGKDKAVVVSHYGHKNKDAVISEDCPTLKAESHGHEPMVIQITGGYGKPTIKNGETGTLQGGGDNVTDKVPNVIVNKGRGFNKGSENEYAGTLTKNSFENNNHVNGIRRLTEIECERLQGLPDNWTKYGVYEKQVWINKKDRTFKIVKGVKEIPKTQRYKLCGNAVTKTMVELIGLKLLQS